MPEKEKRCIVKVAVIGYGNEQTPSTQFRFIQNFKKWHLEGVAAKFISAKRKKKSEFWKILRNSDLILNQKCLFSHLMGRRILKMGKPLLFDFDDAIWTRPGKPFSLITRIRVARRFRFWMRNSDDVWTANEYLSAQARLFRGNVFSYKMALDLDVWTYDESEPGPIRIGWIGSPGNLKYLERLTPILRDILTRKAPQTTFSIFCGSRPHFDFPFHYVSYQPGKENEFVKSLDIGLVPMDDEVFSYGKSPIKSLQYMASGVAVIGQAFGAGAEILKNENSCIVEFDEDWQRKLTALIDNQDLRMKLKRAGRRFVEMHHDRERVASMALARMKALLARNCP